MIDKKIITQSLVFSALAVLYVTLVTRVMGYAGTIFGPDGKSTVGPIVFLLIVVVSAATMGLLVFGKPVMLYMDGKKREAVAMAVCTIGSLAAFATLLIIITAASRG